MTVDSPFAPIQSVCKTMHPSGVLNLHREWLDRFATNQNSESWRSLAKRGRSVRYLLSLEHDESQSVSPVEAFTSAHSFDPIRSAELFWVADDMMPLILRSARELDDDEVWEREWVPSRSGFCVFERGLVFATDDGQTEGTRAISWLPAKINNGADFVLEGTEFQFWSDGGCPDVSYIPASSEETTASLALNGPLTLSRQMFGLPGHPVGSLLSEARLYDPKIGVTALEREFNLVRFMKGLFMIMAQPIVETAPVVLPRPAKRAAKREKRSSHINVINLRRPTGATSGTGGSVSWANQWAVRGHWRNQTVGENYPNAKKREDGTFFVRMWIDSYVKGPEGKPLKISNKVYAVRSEILDAGPVRTSV